MPTPQQSSLETQLSSYSVETLFQLAILLPIDCPAHDLFEMDHGTHTAKPIQKATLVKYLANKLETLERTSNPTQRVYFLAALVITSVWSIYQTILAYKSAYKFANLETVSTAIGVRLKDLNREITNKTTPTTPPDQMRSCEKKPTITSTMVGLCLHKQTLFSLLVHRDGLEKEFKIQQLLKKEELRVLWNRLKTVGFATAIHMSVVQMNTVASRMLRKSDYKEYLTRLTTANDGDSPAGSPTKSKRLLKVYDGCLEPIDDNLHVVFSMQKESKLKQPQFHYWLLKIPGQRRQVRVAHLFTPDGHLRTNVNEIAHEIACAHTLMMRIQDKSFRLGRRMGLTKKRSSTTIQTLKRKHTGTQKKNKK